MTVGGMGFIPECLLMVMMMMMTYYTRFVRVYCNNSYFFLLWFLFSHGLLTMGGMGFILTTFCDDDCYYNLLCPTPHCRPLINLSHATY